MQDIFIRPIVTQHTMAQAGHANRYTFEVARLATKTEIKNACQVLFGIVPLTVHTIVVKGGSKRILSKRSQSLRKQSNWKKAILTLNPGDTISVFEVRQEDKKEKRKKKGS